MSKFKMDDPVRITDPTSEYFDQVGRVAYVDLRDLVFPYNVRLDESGYRPPFREQDLTLADLDVHEVLAEMAEQSGLDTPAKDMAEMEIDGEYVRGGPVDSSHDPVSHPSHYTSHPSNVECIEITRHMGFNLGNAFKYIWRADLKGAAIQDLEKAVFYIQDEIAKRKAAQ